MKVIICDRCGSMKEIKENNIQDITCSLLRKPSFSAQFDLCDQCFDEVISFIKTREPVIQMTTAFNDPGSAKEEVITGPEPELSPVTIDSELEQRLIKESNKYVNTAIRICRTCNAEFHPTSNVQKDCPGCSKKVKSSRRSPG